MKSFWGSKRAIFLFAAGMVLAVLLILLSLIAPIVNRKSTASSRAGALAEQLSPLALAMSHYSGWELQELTQQENQTETDLYRSTAALLNRVKSRYDLANVYLLVRTENGQYAYFVDGDYRDNGTAGVDYQSPGAAFSISDAHLSKQQMDRVWRGEGNEAYSRDLSANADGATLLTALLPVQADSQVCALLGADVQLRNTNFHKLGIMDLHILFYVGLLLLVACGLMFLLQRRKYRAQRPIETDYRPVELQETDRHDQLDQ